MVSIDKVRNIARERDHFLNDLERRRNTRIKQTPIQEKISSKVPSPEEILVATHYPIDMLGAITAQPSVNLQKILA